MSKKFKKIITLRFCGADAGIPGLGETQIPPPGPAHEVAAHGQNSTQPGPCQALGWWYFLVIVVVVRNFRIFLHSRVFRIPYLFAFNKCNIYFLGLRFCISPYRRNMLKLVRRATFRKTYFACSPKTPRLNPSAHPSDSKHTIRK